MIVSANTEANRSEFDILLNSTLNELNEQGKKQATRFSDLAGTKLERYIGDIMTEFAQGTVFENSIKVIGGQKFPDIVARKIFGVEVKTTTQNHWKTTGNSVLESTRVEDVQKIFMLFAKLASPIEFKCRPYEDCLSDVVVTHSPRYLIDMNLPIGNTIFDKMETPYEELRKKENPLGVVVDYYKAKLKPGEKLWWIDQDSGNNLNLSIKIWKNVEKSKQKEIRSKIMVLFPNVFGKSSKNKYEGIPAWLVLTEGIVTPNVRDLFTAGGKSDLLSDKLNLKQIPGIFRTVIENLDSIMKIILETPASELSKYWGYDTTEISKKSDWISLIARSSREISDAKHLDLEKILSVLLS